MKVENLLSKHFDIYYLPCENCGYQTGKCTEESNKKCWKCGKVIHRDRSYKTLKPEIKKLISEKEYNLFHSASNKFMRELKRLLEKHNASIVRSAGEGNKLVISVETKTMFEETEFDEDITIESFTHEWFKRLNYY